MLKLRKRWKVHDAHDFCFARQFSLQQGQFIRGSYTHALTDLEVAKEPLLLHQFLAGILESNAKQLRALGEVTMLDAAIACARLLMTIESESVATLTEKLDEM